MNMGLLIFDLQLLYHQQFILCTDPEWSFKNTYLIMSCSAWNSSVVMTAPTCSLSPFSVFPVTVFLYMLVLRPGIIFTSFLNMFTSTQSSAFNSYIASLISLTSRIDLIIIGLHSTICFSSLELTMVINWHLEMVLINVGLSH